MNICRRLLSDLLIIEIEVENLFPKNRHDDYWINLKWVDLEGVHQSVMSIGFYDKRRFQILDCTLIKIRNYNFDKT